MPVIEQIYIDHAVADQPLTNEVVERFDLPISVIENIDDLYRLIRSAPDPVAAGKKILYLTENKGGFIRNCPGTRNYTCCDYMILHIGTFCTMDCSYCILQSYFHPPVLQYFVNHQMMLDELNFFLASRTHRRIGTGEYTDSMIWELWTDLSQKLIPIFGAQSHVVLELKTKTTHIDNIRHLQHNRRTIMAWSVNSPEVIRINERGTASLKSRLNAAKRCQDWGYPVAFHFDPIVEYDGCIEDYQLVVKRIFDQIDPKNIAWVSLGMLRYMPDLKAIIQKRFPASKMIYGELITGLDGKTRYLKQIRLEIYSAILEAIHEFASDVTVYFCMESEDVWRRVFGFTTKEYGGLSQMLDQAAMRVCKLAS